MASKSRPSEEKTSSAISAALDTALDTAVDAARDAADEAIEYIRPRLRGWLHAGAAPMALVGGLILFFYAPTTEARVALGIYTFSAVLLFGTSAIYHSRVWSPSVASKLRKLDHSNIFVLIAGTYTPFALLGVGGSWGIFLLALIWGGAVAGTVFRLLTDVPRWVSTIVYMALGGVAVAFAPLIVSRAGVLVFSLVALGGLFYVLGGVVYASRRPNLSPRWFGFHEVFHLLTIFAFASQYTAVALLIA